MPQKDRKFISADPEKCVGCVICEYACSMTNEKTFNPTKSRIRALRMGPLNNIAVTCRHCEDPACCNWCISACDFGAIMLHPEKKVVFTCSNCKDQPDGPQCVKWCPEEALELVTSDVLAQKARITAVKKLFQEAVKTPKK
jgi:Fe-S-cluster-containing hydrogenase component 2